ncbi:copia protein [Tanacetum coccineum]
MSPPIRRKYHDSVAFATGCKKIKKCRRGNRKIRIPIAMWPCRVEEKMTLKEVDGQAVEEIETKIIAKDGTITRVPGKFQGYETSEEEPLEQPRRHDLYGFVDHPQLQQGNLMNEFAPHWLPQSNGNMNGWLLEDEDEVERNEVDSDLESTARRTVVIQDSEGMDSCRFALWEEAIRTKWFYRNKKDERGVVVKNKTRIFLAFSSYMGFIVYQIDVKSAFLYGTIDEEVYRRGTIDKTLFIKKDKNDIMFQFTPKTHITCCEEDLLGILKAKPLWQPRKSSFDMVAYSDSDYVVLTLTEIHTKRKLNCCYCILLRTSLVDTEPDVDYGLHFMNTRNILTMRDKICIVKKSSIFLQNKASEIRHHIIRDAYEKKLIRGGKMVVGTAGTKVHTARTGSPEQTTSGQTATGKESSNPLMADSLPKTIQSNDPPLSRGYTLGSGEDNLKLMELMAYCINLCEFVSKKNKEIK